MRWFLVLILTFITYFLADYWLNLKIPKWKQTTTELMKSAEEAQISAEKWAALHQKSLDKLPQVYPFSVIQDSFAQMTEIVAEVSLLSSFQFTPSANENKKSIAVADVEAILDKVENITESVEDIIDNLESIPVFLLSESQKLEREQVMAKTRGIRQKIRELKGFHKIFNQFCEDEKSVLILLQNNNEPRSSGGFVGSFMRVDFSETLISWNFLDMYAVDRKIALEDQLPAPEFFHDLSKTISLRDANFWPDFPTTAKMYRNFFKKADSAVPDTIVAINLNLLQEVLKITGPVSLDQWGITLDEHNYDLALQFLVESKVAGRFATKEPVFVLINKIVRKLKAAEFDRDKLVNFNWRQVLKEKEVLAYSEDRQLQQLFESWGLTGELKIQQKTDDFVYFDFMSVGANKSEKFIKTKIWHNSQIQSNGKVLNELEITRSHALHHNEIQNLLHINSWSENIRDLLDDELLWKLGEGENRTMIRVYAPKYAKKISAENPAGKIVQHWSEHEFCQNEVCQVFEIPMNVLPGESLSVKLTYEVPLERGSHNWRPYLFETRGTPGRKNTTFMKTISTEGSFSAETKNIGLPQKLSDAEYRVVIEFK